MSTRTPTIYATGRWVLKRPFSVNPETVYVCVAIRSLQELEFNDALPYERYYGPHRISLTDYENDKLNLANIVTLVSDTDETIYVPDTYIQSFPDKTTVPYTHVVLSASMGYCPDSLDFSDVKNRIEELLLDTVGIDTTVLEHQAGYTTKSVEYNNHLVIENARKNLMANNETLLAKNRKLEEELERLRDLNSIATDLLIDNGILES